MSKEIDEKVVSMQFDNRNFETNVQTTMSTLDKLKEKLHFKGVTKGLDEISNATGKINMTPLANSVEAVSVKFSALQVAGIAAITNLTNSAVNAGKRIVSALTIEPVTTGFREYELKMDSVKTIMASTGESVETVNKYLEELNEYSDQTIYSFSDMTQNIGKFTNAGVKLKDAVAAIKGISNEAAVSGANANEASRAMYNFAQALSSGFVKLIDWKSIENANMATVEFKQELIDTAVQLGIVKKLSNGMYETKKGKEFNATQNFNDVLQDQWMTTEVLVQTLGRYADSTTDIGKKAFAAAQDVYKMSQMFDILKETAQSGWAKTWEIIFGDIDKAKAFFTPITEFFSKIINSMSDFRNNLLEGAFGNPFKAFLEKLDNSGLGTIKKYIDATAAYADKLEYFQKVVTDVWRGDYNNHGDNPDRYDLLDAAGYNHKVVQRLVNKGYLYKLTVEDIKEAHDKFGVSLEDTTEVVSETAVALEDLTDEQLRNAGFTEEEIKLFRELANEAKRTGKPLRELIEEMSNIDGRTMVIQSFQNIGGSLVKIFSAIKQAWVEIFPPMTSLQLFNIIRAFHSLSERLAMSDDTADKLKRTLKGVFAIIDIITTITGGALKIALKAIAKALGLVDIDILSVTANIGDAIVAVRDWIDAHNIFAKGAEVLIPLLSRLVSAIRDWVKGLREADNIPEYIITSLINGIKKGGKMAVDAVIALGKKIIEGIEKTFGINIPGGKIIEIGKNIISGLNEGIFSGAKTVISTIIDIGKKLIEAIKSVLDIHSPSRKFYEIGENIIQGLVNGLQNGASLAWDVVKTIGLKLIEIVKDLDIGTIFAGVIATGLTVATVKMADAFQSFAAPMEGLGSMLESVGDMLEDVGVGVKSLLKGASLKLKADAMLSLAFAIGVLAASLFVISKIKPGPLWNAVAAVGVLIVLMGGLLAVADKSSDLKNIGSRVGMIIGVAAAILIMAFAMEKLAGIDDGALQGVLLLIVMVMALVALIESLDYLGKPEVIANISKVGTMLIKLSIALLLMTAVIAIAGNMDGETIAKGLAAILGVSLIFIALVKAAKTAGEFSSSAGGMLLKMSIALLLIIGVVKLASKLDQSEVNKGLEFMASVMVLFGIFMIFTSMATMVGQHASKAGTMLLKISVALLIMVGVVKLISMMKQGDIEKGVAAISTIIFMFTFLIAASAIVAAVGKEASKAGTMIIKLSIALLLIAGIVVILSLIKPDALARSVAATSAIIILFTIMMSFVAILNVDTEKPIKILTRLTIIIALLGIIIAGLSFIEPSRLGLATAAISSVMVIFIMFMKATKSMKVSKKLQTQMLWMIGIVGALTLFIGLLSLAEPERALAAAGALSTVMLLFSVAMVIMSKAVTQSQTIYKRMAALVAVTLALAVIIAGLSQLDPLSAIASATALSVLMEALASSMLIISKAKGVTMTSMGALGIMTGVVALLAIILGVMAGFGVEASIPTAISLGILLNAMAAAMLILSKAGATAQMAVPATVALIEVISMLGLFLVALGGLNELFGGGVADLISSGGNVLELIGLAIGKFIGGIFGGISEGVYAGMPGIGEKLSEFATNAGDFFTLIDSINPDSVQSVKTLAEALLVISESGLVDSLSTLFGEENADMGEQMQELGKGLKKFAESTVGIDSNSVSSAANAVKILAEVVNEIPKEGGLIQDFFGTVNVGKFGADLTSLGKGLRGFVDAIGSDFSAETVDSAANAAMSLAEVANNIPKQNGLMQDIFGSVDIHGFARQLQRFGQGIAEFAAEIQGVDADTVTAAANSAMALAEVANNIPKQNGLMQNVFGSVDIHGFSRQLQRFGQGIAEFAVEIKDVKPDTVTAAASAAKVLTEVANNIPKQNGLMQNIFGDTDITGFARQLGEFGLGLKQFAAQVSGITNIDTVKKAAEAAESIAGVGKILKDNESIWDYFSGQDKSAVRFENFGRQLSSLGRGMCSFAKEITGITDIDKVRTASSAVLDLADVAKKLTEDEGFFERLSNSKDYSMDKFATEIRKLGDALMGFATNIFYMNTSQVEKATNIAGKLIELIKTFVIGDRVAGEIEVDVLGQVLEQIGSLGTGMRDFINMVAPLDFGNANELMTVIDSMIGVMERIPAIQDMRLAYLGTQMISFTSSLATFCTNVKTLDLSTVNKGLADVDTIVTKINEILTRFSESIGEKTPVFQAKGIALADAVATGLDSSKNKIYNAGKALIEKMAEGVKDPTTQTSVNNALIKVVDDMLLNTKTIQQWERFKSTGIYLVQGFANGITGESSVAVRAAESMASRVLAAINAALGVESPSKEMYKIADFCNQGFAKGMEATTYKSVESSDRMADAVKLSFTTAISRVRDMLENGVDAQPTIRPVLDLSDVASGARGINNLFNTNPTIGVMSNVRAISSTMSRRQNGGNDEVVSAIKSLEESINSRPVGDTYTIDGITYDDGSNISSAIKVLTRYAKMERRR